MTCSRQARLFADKLGLSAFGSPSLAVEARGGLLGNHWKPHQGSKNNNFNELGQHFQGFSNTQMIPLLDPGETRATPRLDEVEFNSLVAAAANQGCSLRSRFTASV